MLSSCRGEDHHATLPSRIRGESRFPRVSLTKKPPVFNTIMWLISLVKQLLDGQ
jgi:hypothetical protein